MTTEDLTVAWLRSDERPLFRLYPLAVVDRATLRRGDVAVVRKGKNQNVLVAAFNGHGIVSRSRATGAELGMEARRLAAKTGDSVLIGQQVALDDDVPIWELVGRVVTRKVDPLSAEAFDTWAMEMASRVMTVSRADLAELGVEALEYLEFNFKGASVGQIERALAGYRTTIASPTATMMRTQQVSITRALQPILRSTSLAAQKIPEVKAGLGAGFTIRDKEVSRLLAQHHTFWVRDKHGAISQDLSARARSIISRGVDRGLGNREISKELKVLTKEGLQMPGYWNTVAANHVARARTYSLGASYRAAGIQRYKIQAVLDDRTTHQCLFLHEKVLPVGPAMARVDKTLNDSNPESVLWNQPFISDNGDNLTVDYPDGSKVKVADITQRSSGASPTGGSASFSNGMSGTEMVDAAIGFPPYHFGCRTTTIPL